MPDSSRTIPEFSSRMLSADRSPDVNSYVGYLRDQMLAVCAKYGVAYLDGLARLVRDGTVTAEDRSLVRDLREALTAAMRDNKIPAGDRDWKRRKAELSSREAAEAMGAGNVLGPERAAATFGLDLESLEIPPVPFSVAELERAKELNQFLVFRVSKAADGSPLSMRKMSEVLSPRFKAENKGAVLRNIDWCKDDPFFRDDAPAAGWALVSREVVLNTPSKNFLQQTEELVRYLRDDAFKGRELPQKYLDAIAQFEAAKPGIAAIIGSEWKKAAERLEALDITSLTRQSPAEAAYDAMLVFDRTGVRHLPGIYTWTSRRSSDGFLVFVGLFDPAGLFVNGLGPGNSSASLGVAFSRR